MSQQVILICQALFIIIQNVFFKQPVNNRLDSLKNLCGGFPGGAVVKNPPANAGDTGLIPGPGRSHMLWSN